MGQSVTNGACRRALRTRTRLDSLSGPLPTCHSAAAAKSSMWERAARQTSPSWRSLIHPSAALRSVSTSSGSAHISSPRRPSPAGRWTRRNVFLVLFVSRRAIFPLDPCRCLVPRASCPFDVILLFQSHYCWTYTHVSRHRSIPSQPWPLWQSLGRHHAPTRHSRALLDIVGMATLKIALRGGAIKIACRPSIDLLKGGALETRISHLACVMRIPSLTAP